MIFKISILLSFIVSFALAYPANDTDYRQQSQAIMDEYAQKYNTSF